MEANQEAQSAQNADVRVREEFEQAWPTAERGDWAGLVAELEQREIVKRGANPYVVAARQHRDAISREHAGYLAAIRHAVDTGAKVTELAAALGISRTAVYKQLGRKEKT